jgi:hypothetical protein
LIVVDGVIIFVVVARISGGDTGRAHTTQKEKDQHHNNNYSSCNEKEKTHTTVRQNTATDQMCLRVFEVLVLVVLAHTFWY